LPAIPRDTKGLPAIVAREVSKTFRVPQERKHTLKERVLHPRSRTRHQVFHALNDISFAVAEGEFFGIAGRNGSGKSTLLKCIAGIYGVEGEIWRRGRVSTFIELGVGFNADLAARDNVILNGIMLGLSPREARKRYDSVIEFAELKEFEDLKLKNYSSGMYVRLAFSVAIQVDADLLLIDEILAVGDASFQQKCFDVFNRMRDSGKTIVFVTHDMGALNRFCHRALLLERGSQVYIGDPQEVGDQGQRQPAVPQGRRMTLRARVSFMVEVEDPQASVYVHNEEHKAVLVASTVLEHEHSGRFRSGEQAVFSFSFDNVLAPGRYNPVFNLAHRGSGLDVIDRFEGAFSFVVTAQQALGGIVDVPVEVVVERGESVPGGDLPPSLELPV